MVLIVNYQPEQYMATAVKTVQMNVTPGTTVKGLLSTIADARYDKYQFSESGQGCRYWISRTAKLLQSKGHLTEDDDGVDTLEEVLRTVWAFDGNPVPDSEQTGIQRGNFLS
jgi:hypothetical protein